MRQAYSPLVVAVARLLGRQLVLFVALMIAYSLFSVLGLRWGFVRGAASPVWPAAGVALAGLMLGGIRLWPAVFCGRLTAFLIIGSDLPAGAQIAIASGNALSAVVGAQAMQWAKANLGLQHVREALSLAATAAGSAAVAATVGVEAIAVADAEVIAPFMLWLHWWAGNVAGTIVIAPFILSWARSNAVPRNRRWWVQLILSSAAATVIAYVVFGPEATPLARTWLVFPALVWAALAAGVKGASTAMVFVSAVAVWGTTQGYGPLADVGTGDLEQWRFLLLPQFIAVAAITMLVLAVVSDERRGTALLKASEARLQKSELRLQLALEAGQLGFWEWDVPSGYVHFNEQWAAMLGYHPAEVEPHVRAWEKMIHPEDRERTMRTLADHLEGRTEFYECEHRLLHKDGSWRWILDRGQVVLRNSSGKPLRTLGTHADITERKQIEAALKEGDRRKDDFLATLAHELRNPLAPISSAVQILKLQPSSDPLLQSASDMIGRQVRHMARLIDDLLDVSRITRGKLQLRKEQVELSAVMEQALEAARPHIEQSNHQLHVNLPTAAIWLNADPVRIAQVFSNLLNNAAKYTEAGGQLWLSAYLEGEEVVVTVKDTGIGIPPEHLGTLFQMFSQVQSALHRSHGGLGIGLSLAQGLIEMHNGTIAAVSGGLGQGSEFIVRLPVVARDSLSQPSFPISEPAGAAGCKVLVADDNQDAALSLASMLKMLGNEVSTAHDGQEAIDVGENLHPDIVLLDIGMPRLNGYETAKRMRERPWGRDAVLVAITGWGQEEDKKRAMLAGFDHHLVKPAEISELRRILVDALQQRRQRCVGPTGQRNRSTD
jgi:PAS domain S-box-containing protein